MTTPRLTAASIEIEWYTPEELSHILKLNTDQLSKMRIKGDGPPFVKVAGKIRYSKRDLLIWNHENQQTGTRPKVSA